MTTIQRGFYCSLAVTLICKMGQSLAFFADPNEAFPYRTTNGISHIWHDKVYWFFGVIPLYIFGVLFAGELAVNIVKEIRAARTKSKGCA